MSATNRTDRSGKELVVRFDHSERNDDARRRGISTWSSPRRLVGEWKTEEEAGEKELTAAAAGEEVTSSAIRAGG
jgi:hypothetical protein